MAAPNAMIASEASQTNLLEHPAVSTEFEAGGDLFEIETDLLKEVESDAWMAPGPDVHAQTSEDLREMLSSEVERALSILASLTDVGPVQSPRPVEPRKAISFAAVERFWGQESSLETESVSEPVKKASDVFTTQWTSLQSVFKGASTKKVPERGFAQDEDPVSLSGFTAIAERETVTQSYSFGFSFGSTPAEASVNNPAAAPLPATPSSDSLIHSSELKLNLWGDSSEISELAESFIAQAPSLHSEWKEMRQVLLLDLKRKCRSKSKGRAGTEKLITI